MLRSLSVLLLWTLLALPAGAVIIDRPDGSTNTTPPAPDPGFAHVANVGGLGAVYLGNGWVLTANHVAVGPAEIGGTMYPPLLHSKVQLQPEGAATLLPDLALWRLTQPWPPLPTLPIRKAAFVGLEPLVMIGNGAERTGTTNWMGFPGYTWGGSHVVRWGTNAVEGFPAPDPFLFVSQTNTETHAFFARFDCTCTETGGDEAMGVNGDSGGAVFIESGGMWRLAGVMFATGAFIGQPAQTVVVGNVTWAADLSVYRDQILAITAPAIPALPLWGAPSLGVLMAGVGGLVLRRRRPWGQPGGQVRKQPATGGGPR